MTHGLCEPVKSSTLSMLEEGYVDIENILNDIEDPKDYELLRDQLMKRIKEKPHSANLFELLGIVFLELGMLEDAEKVKFLQHPISRFREIRISIISLEFCEEYRTKSK
jgi:hypothetical protein